MSDDRKIRIVLAGVDAQGMAATAQAEGGSLVEAAGMADMKAARLVKSGQADYYLGTCWSGGGGALAAATAILGSHQTAIVGTPGMAVKKDHVGERLADGCKAFGFPYEQSKSAIPTVVRAILEYHQKADNAS